MPAFLLIDKPTYRSAFDLCFYLSCFRSSCSFVQASWSVFSNWNANGAETSDCSRRLSSKFFKDGIVRSGVPVLNYGARLSDEER